MSKNETNQQDLENKNLADALSAHINNSSYLISKDDIAKALGIPSEALQYDSKGVKISPKQIANLNPQKKQKIKDLYDIDEGFYDTIQGEEDDIVSELLKIENAGLVGSTNKFDENQHIYENVNQEPIYQNVPNQYNFPSENEPVAQDFFIDASAGLNQAVQQLSNPTLSISETPDPIIVAVRTEILEKERELVTKYLIEQEKDEKEKQKLLNLNLGGDPKAYSSYTKENQEKYKKALQDPKLKAALENAEIKGYSNVLNQDRTYKYPNGVESKFKKIEWNSSPAGIGGASSITTRTQVVRNADNNEIATLTESTHQAPIKVSVGNQEVELKNYRTINFPIETENKTGPMHLSMAAKDPNGKNIALSKAVYFTAHYDDSGKLTEVSYPKPIMFSCKGDNAIGYIEHQGQIYTLPVTQGKYREMMKAIGREEEIALSQSINAPELAKDSMMIGTGHGKKSPGVSKEDPKKGEKSYIEKQVDEELHKQKQYSLKGYKESVNKEKFLQDLVESDLSVNDKAKYLNEISNNGNTKQVMSALASSKLTDKDKQDITGSLLRNATDLERIEMIEELGKSADGRKLIINSFEKGSSKERYDISNAIAESSVEQKTDLTKRVILAIERTGQESAINSLNKASRDGERLVDEVEQTSSDVSIENAVAAVEPKPEEPKKGQEEERQPSKEEDKINTRTNNLITKLSEFKPVSILRNKSDQEISDMAKPLSKELNGKSLNEQKNIIEEKLKELSNKDKVSLLKRLNEMEADKRGERINQVQEEKIQADKNDKSVMVQTSKRSTDSKGSPTEEVGRFENKKELVNIAGNIGLMAYINNKINELNTSQTKTPLPPKPKRDSFPYRSNNK